MVTPKLRTIDSLKHRLLGRTKPVKLASHSDGTELLEYDPTLTHKIIVATDACAKPKIKNSLMACIDRAGARTPYRCELYPSTRSQSSTNQKSLGVMYSNLDKRYSEFPTFANWFSTWVDGRIVAPDTGIILNHSLSQVLLPRFPEKRLRIQIPRLVMLELEAKASRKNGKEKNEDKRLSLSAFDEIRRLRLESNASIFSKPLDMPLLTSVSSIAGEGWMDKFIRREIRDQMYSAGVPKWSEEIVLLTRDLIMASAASAEEIDSFYLCPAKPEATEFSVDADKAAKIILETAVAFEKVRIDGLIEGQSIICEGMWSGKTVIDWYRKRCRIDSIDASTKGNP